MTSYELQSWENRLLPSLMDNINFIVDNIPDNGILYDIGANTGLLTSEILKRKPDLEVFMFEPVSEYYTIVANKFLYNPNITVYQYALTDLEGSIKISIDNNNRGYNTLTNIREYGMIQEVPTTSLSKLIKKSDMPIADIMKIDVEESEYMVIEGYKELMDQGHLPKIIYMEIGIRTGHTLWQKEKDMIEYLFSIGYERFDYENMNHTYDAIFKLK